MKKTEDTLTLEMKLDAKRGRGRPAKEDKLTPAERAKRYRAKHKSDMIKSDVTKYEENQKIIEWEHEKERDMYSEIKEMEKEIKELAEMNAGLSRELDQGRNDVDETNKHRGDLVRTVRRLEAENKLLETERNNAFRRNSELEIKIKLCDASLN